MAVSFSPDLTTDDLPTVGGGGHSPQLPLGDGEELGISAQDFQGNPYKTVFSLFLFFFN